MCRIALDNAQEHAHQSIVDVLNHEFGRTYESYRRSACVVAENVVVWFPSITCDANRVPRTGWQNLLSEDANEIVTRYRGDDPRHAEAYARRHDGFTHIVFARMEGTGLYQFIGVYDSTRNRDIRYYRRIATEIVVRPDGVDWPPAIR